jgi:hypothetical protein
MQLSASSSARRASPACGEEEREDCEPSSGAASGLSVSQQAEVAWGGACRSAAERLLSRTGSAGTSARPTEKQCAASQKRAAAYLAPPPSPSGAVPPPRPATAGMGQAGWLPRCLRQKPRRAGGLDLLGVADRFVVLCTGLRTRELVGAAMDCRWQELHTLARHA